MTMSLDLRGLWVPLITPFDRSGAVDGLSLRQLANDMLDAGAAGVVALGTTGESPVLDDAEKRTVIEICGEACAGRGAPLMVGTGTNDTRSTVAHTSALADVAAAKAALVVVPYYNRPSEQAIVEHLKLVADHSPVPVVVYNIPYRTGRGLGAASLLELAEHPNIVGVKQAVAALDQDTLVLLRDKPDGFGVLAGDDAFILPTVLMGGVGAIAAAAHVCTEAFAAMVEAGLDQRVEVALDLSDRLLEVVAAGFAEPNPAVWKAVLHAEGRIPTPNLRRPLTPASPQARDRLLAAIAIAAATPAPVITG